jgi:hypothetical protein
MKKTKKLRLVLHRETVRDLGARSLQGVRGGESTSCPSCPSCVTTCDACPPGGSAGCDPNTNSKKSFCFDCEI